MRPSRITSLAPVFLALGALVQPGCCWWWHHRHCRYAPAPDCAEGPAAAPLGQPGMAGVVMQEPPSLPHEGQR
jgi:hypothetical protein